MNNDLPGVSSFTNRISGDGAAAWDIHLEASKAFSRGEDVIMLSIGAVSYTHLTLPTILLV